MPDIYLIGSADTTRFSATYTISSTVNNNRIWFIGRNDDPNNSIASGTANTLSLYISNWGTQTNIKCCLYDETGGGALLESVIVPSSVGTGLVNVALAGTTTITSGRLYRLGIYTEDSDGVTFFSDTTGLTLRQTTLSGDYTNPIDPSQLGSYDSDNEFYWSIQEAASGPSITSITDPVTTNSSATITGTGFEATQGTGGVTQGGVAVTETAWSDTSVTFDSVDIETSALKYGNQTFVLTADGGGSDSITADVQPATNRAYVGIGTPATAGDRITATPVDLATNDQVAYDTRLFASDGVTPTAYTVSIDSTGVFTLGGGPIPDGTYYIKDIRIYDNSDNTWGALADQTVTIGDGAGETTIKATVSGIIGSVINNAVN